MIIIDQSEIFGNKNRKNCSKKDEEIISSSSSEREKFNNYSAHQLILELLTRFNVSKDKITQEIGFPCSLVTSILKNPKYLLTSKKYYKLLCFYFFIISKSSRIFNEGN